MMEGRRNRVKNKTPFKKWLEAESGVNVPTYLKQNFIPQDVSYKIDDFEELVLLDGLFYKKFTDTPFTGKVIGGQKQGSIKDGKKEGKW